jgi:multidrug efflux pump subunit AcrB
MARFLIDRPILTVAIAMLMSLAGALAIVTLPGDLASPVMAQGTE